MKTIAVRAYTGWAEVKAHVFGLWAANPSLAHVDDKGTATFDPDEWVISFLLNGKKVPAALVRDLTEQEAIRCAKALHEALGNEEPVEVPDYWHDVSLPEWWRSEWFCIVESICAEALS